MHSIEPHYNWRGFYVASEDEQSPFYGREYSEFEFIHSIYDHALHPQWDDFGSPTLFVKILFVNYDEGTAILEFIGEWNDAINNDIMHLKRNIIEELMAEGVHKFLLVGENILIYHSSDDCYYEEWFDECEDGWIAMIGLQPHVSKDMSEQGIDQYFYMDPHIDSINWRTFNPDVLCQYIDQMIAKRLTI